jgi:hypothetical protein
MEVKREDDSRSCIRTIIYRSNPGAFGWRNRSGMVAEAGRSVGANAKPGNILPLNRRGGILRALRFGAGIFSFPLIGEKRPLDAAAF